MSDNREPLIPAKNNLEFLLADNKEFIVERFCDDVLAGAPLKDKDLESHHPGFDTYFGFLASILTDAPPTAQTKEVTSRGFHFGYYMSSWLITPNLVLKGYYTEPSPRAMADRIITDANNYLNVRPNIDSVILSFSPDLTDGAEHLSSLARTSAGLALIHVEQYQRSAIREKQIAAEIADLRAQLDAFDGI